MILLYREAYTRMVEYGESAYPEEAGGLLLGTTAHISGYDDLELTVMEFYPLKNIQLESRHNRIEIDPLEYANAERYAIKKKVGVWGFFHTHPNAKAIPSEFDRAHFPFTEWWYPILSVKDGKSNGCRCWRFTDEHRNEFKEVVMQVP